MKYTITYAITCLVLNVLNLGWALYSNNSFLDLLSVRFYLLECIHLAMHQISDDK
jgi:hypothetical protein